MIPEQIIFVRRGITVYTVKKCSWGWASLSPETRRADLKRSINGICCILLVAYIVIVIKCMVWFSLRLLSETFRILRIVQQDLISAVRSSCKEPVILGRFNETWIFLGRFSGSCKYQISWKSVQREPSCSLRTDGHTWRSWQSFSQFFKRALKPFS